MLRLEKQIEPWINNEGKGGGVLSSELQQAKNGLVKEQWIADISKMTCARITSVLGTLLLVALVSLDLNFFFSR